MFSEIVRMGASEELDFMVNDDVLNGANAAGASGILQSGALVTVSKETTQAAATVVYKNLVKMWQRLHPRSRANAVWYINSEVEPELDNLSISIGTTALEPRFVNYSADGVMRIKGRPVVTTEFNAALGTVGDIVLADMSEYLFWEKRGIEAATSIHVQFLTDQTVFRFVYRADGQTSMASPLTPYKGTATQSAFVALATRA
jgi:HK97 family phage major capsid protein